MRPSPDLLAHKPAAVATMVAADEVDLVADLAVVWVLVEGEVVKSTSPTFVTSLPPLNFRREC